MKNQPAAPDDCYCAPKTSVGKAIFWGKIAAGGSLILVSLTPYIADVVDFHPQDAYFIEPTAMCANGSGARGFLGQLSQFIPQAGLLNAVVSCAAIVGGKYLHNYLAENGRPKLGKIASGTSTVVGIAAVAPTIIESVKYGVSFMLAASGNISTALDLENTLGTSGMIVQDGAAWLALLSGHTGCIVSAVTAFASTFIPIKCKNNIAVGERTEWVDKTNPIKEHVDFASRPDGTGKFEL